MKTVRLSKEKYFVIDKLPKLYLLICYIIVLVTNSLGHTPVHFTFLVVFAEQFSRCGFTWLSCMKKKAELSQKSYREDRLESISL